MSPSSALGSSQRSVVSHRRVGGFSDSSFPGLYSVDKVSSEFFFLHASSRCFRKTHQKCRQRRVGIDFARGSAAEPRNAKRGGAKTRGHFPTHPIRGLRNADPERRRRPSGGGERRRRGFCRGGRWSDERARRWLQGKVNVSLRSFLHLFLCCSNS